MALPGTGRHDGVLGVVSWTDLRDKVTRGALRVGARAAGGRRAPRWR